MYCFFIESSREYKKLEKNFLELPTFYFHKKYRIFKNLLEARVLFFKTDMKKASQKLLKCLPYFKKNGFVDETAYIFFMLGEMYQVAQSFDVARLMFEKALDIYQKSQNFYAVPFLMLAKGMLLGQQDQFEEAEDCFEKAEKFYIKTKNINEFAQVKYMLVLTYQNNGNSAKAEKALKDLKKHVKKHKITFLDENIKTLENSFYV